MSTAFETQELIPQNFFQKIFGIKPKENSIIELNNVLAKKAIESLVVDDISNIISKYHVNIFKTYSEKIAGFYKSYLEYCLKDRHLSENESEALKNLKFVLKLNDTATQEIFDNVAKDVYKFEVAKAVADGVLEKEEETFLLNLEKTLHMPHDLAMSIYGEEARDLYSKTVASKIVDGQLSPDEEKQLESLAANLRVEIANDEGVTQVLNKYKLFWQIDNGILPQIDVGINLSKSEICHCVIQNIVWHEQHMVNRRIGYSGLSYRVNIAKGLSWRVGNIAPEIVSEDVWKTIDTGDLYLTQKRIIFMGTKVNKTLPFSRILDFCIYTNGIEIKKDSGKNPFFEFAKNSDIFGAILGKLLNDL